MRELKLSSESLTVNMVLVSVHLVPEAWKSLVSDLKQEKSEYMHVKGKISSWNCQKSSEQFWIRLGW